MSKNYNFGKILICELAADFDVTNLKINLNSKTFSEIERTKTPDSAKNALFKTLLAACSLINDKEYQQNKFRLFKVDSVNSLAILHDYIIGVVDINDESFNQIEIYLETANKIKNVRNMARTARNYTNQLLTDLAGTDISILKLDFYQEQLMNFFNIYGNETYVDCIDKLKRYINKTNL